MQKYLDLLYSYTLIPSIIIVATGFKWWYIDTAPCDGLKHIWGKWIPDEKKQEQVRQCIKCGFSIKKII